MVLKFAIKRHQLYLNIDIQVVKKWYLVKFEIQMDQIYEAVVRYSVESWIQRVYREETPLLRFHIFTKSDSYFSTIFKHERFHDKKKDSK